MTRHLSPLALLFSSLLSLTAFGAPPEAAKAPRGPDFLCVDAPVVEQPPQELQHADAAESGERLARPCPEGKVPQPVARHAPKRHPSRTTSAELAAQGLAYFYAGGYQYQQALGVFGNATQHAPFLAAGDFHTLFEFAAQDSTLNQIVEVGWTVDQGLNGDTQPRLFVFHWINGTAQCYNGCGWVQVSTTRFPGMVVTATSTAQGYGIRNYNGNWWVYYQGEAIGYFPGSRWGGTYTQMALAQWFGEVAANVSSPGTDMGTGAFGSAAGSASANTLYFLLPNNTTVYASASANVTHPSLYNVGGMAGSAFRYGGPGAF